MPKIKVIFHNSLGPIDGELASKTVDEGQDAYDCAMELLMNTDGQLEVGDGIVVVEVAE